jgi:hypothetical protein
MQFDRAFLRILQQIAQSDPHVGPVYLSKINIADGFYRIAIHPDDIPKLAIMFPTQDGEKQLISLPLVLPMGWKQSHPLFKAAMETVADLANTKLQAKVSSQAHRLYAVSESPIKLKIPSPINMYGPAPLPLPVPVTRFYTRPHPVKSWDVYVDDFIGMVQGSSNHRRHAKQVLLHSLNKVLHCLDPSDNPHRQEPVSIKKMLKGDATWATRKIVFG